MVPAAGASCATPDPGPGTSALDRMRGWFPPKRARDGRPVGGMSAQCRYQADTYIHAGWSADLGVAPEVGGVVLNRYVAAATRGVRSLALIS